MRLLIATLVWLAHASGALAATAYTLDGSRSWLGFTANQSGGDFDGRFEKFTAQIVFADADLDASSFDVAVEMQSVYTHDDDRDTVLRSAELFHVTKFPQARFVTTGFTRQGPGRYEAAGKLTIRDVTRDIRVPVSFETTREGGEPVAWLKGGVALRRLDYGVGEGDWKDTTWVADEVQVKFELRLRPAATPGKGEEGMKGM